MNGINGLIQSGTFGVSFSQLSSLETHPMGRVYLQSVPLHGQVIFRGVAVPGCGCLHFLAITAPPQKKTKQTNKKKPARNIHIQIFMQTYK